MKRMLLSLAWVLTLPVFAQKVKTVEGEYTYHAPENVTLEQAKRTALDRAMLQALADEFGTIVSQTTSTRVSNKGGQTDVNFLSIGGSDVKGEWLETIGEPIYNIRYAGEMLVVTCRVKGRGREIVTAAIDFQARVLRNGIEDRFEGEMFRNGDDLYLSFQSPVSGYLAVYLVDAERQAYCLLPYRNQTDGIFPVKANERYVFFHARSAPMAERPFVDEYTMTCGQEPEHNQVYIIFSPNQFVKASDASTSELLPRQLSNEAFQQWLAKCRKRDKDMNLRMVPITVE